VEKLVVEYEATAANRPSSASPTKTAASVGMTYKFVVETLKDFRAMISNLRAGGFRCWWCLAVLVTAWFRTCYISNVCFMVCEKIFQY